MPFPKGPLLGGSPGLTPEEYQHTKINECNDRQFVQPAPAAKKNSILHKFLVLIGLREEEEEIINEEEKLRRYTIAMQGWKKVKKTLTIIRYRG